MNRRADERIEMRLPCHLVFPDLWSESVVGVTANLHRNGVLVACELSSFSERIPRLGERAYVRIELPSHPAFSPKCIDCEGSLIRIRHGTAGEWQFALRILTVCFSEIPEISLGRAVDAAADSRGYIH